MDLARIPRDSNGLVDRSWAVLLRSPLNHGAGGVWLHDGQTEPVEPRALLRTVAIWGPEVVALAGRAEGGGIDVSPALEEVRDEILALLKDRPTHGIWAELAAALSTPPPKTLEEEIGSLPAEHQAEVRAFLAGEPSMGPMSREECLTSAAHLRDQKLPAIAAEVEKIAETRATNAEIDARLAEMRAKLDAEASMPATSPAPEVPADTAGAAVPDNGETPRLDPSESGPSISAEAAPGVPIAEVAGTLVDLTPPSGTLPATPEPIAPETPKPKGKKKG